MTKLFTAIVVITAYLVVLCVYRVVRARRIRRLSSVSLLALSRALSEFQKKNRYNSQNSFIENYNMSARLYKKIRNRLAFPSNYELGELSEMLGEEYVVLAEHMQLMCSKTFSSISVQALCESLEYFEEKPECQEYCSEVREGVFENSRFLREEVFLSHDLDPKILHFRKNFVAYAIKKQEEFNTAIRYRQESSV